MLLLLDGEFRSVELYPPVIGFVIDEIHSNYGTNPIITNSYFLVGCRDTTIKCTVLGPQRIGIALQTYSNEIKYFFRYYYFYSFRPTPNWTSSNPSQKTRN